MIQKVLFQFILRHILSCEWTVQVYYNCHFEVQNDKPIEIEAIKRAAANCTILADSVPATR